MRFFIYIGLFFSFDFTIAQSLEKTEVLREDQLSEKVEEIKKQIQAPKFVESEEFSKQLLKFRKSALTYLNELEVFCRRGVREKDKRVKMAKSERKNCFAELKNTYSQLIEQVYVAQKKNLEDSHKKEFQNLESMYQSSISHLEGAYKRYLK